MEKKGGYMENSSYSACNNTLIWNGYRYFWVGVNYNGYDYFYY